MKNAELKIMTSISVMLISFTIPALAHCDTMDGPVVKAALAALEKGDVTPVLKWVKKEYEEEVRRAFQRTLKVRKISVEAKDLADIYFFETVVRLHRAGEGEPYTGLKPSGTPIEPIVSKADKALETGNIQELTQHITALTEESIIGRFKKALEARKNADKSIDAGREYVEAYVEFVHYVEKLHQLVEGSHEADKGHDDHK